MELVILTGMSGAGKSAALKMLEDMGYLCVDNLPIALFESFSELTFSGTEGPSKIALGIDSRSGKDLSTMNMVLNKMTEDKKPYKILFLDADDDVLRRRYKETRRNHPLSVDGRVDEGIALEREKMQFLKDRADYIIDTSRLLTRDLNAQLKNIFLEKRKYTSLNINVVSFGFKYGIPQDADMIFDVRFLPNPYYIAELKPYTGEDAPVHEYVMQFPEAETFLEKVMDLMQFLLPHYVEEGKNQLVIGIGCTGGKHRSVTLAIELYERLKREEGYGVKLEHVDIEKDAKRGK